MKRFKPLCYVLSFKAILDKATCHTKILLQKSEERTKALEKVSYSNNNYIFLKITFNSSLFLKIGSHSRETVSTQEVNALQWEITFNQVQFKNVENSWSLKYERYTYQF